MVSNLFWQREIQENLGQIFVQSKNSFVVSHVGKRFTQFKPSTSLIMKNNSEEMSITLWPLSCEDLFIFA